MSGLKQMQKYNFLKFIIVLLGVIAIYFYFFEEKFREYNLKKSILSCVIAQKRISDSLDVEKAKISCEEKIRKQ